MYNFEFEESCEELMREYEADKRAGKPHTDSYDKWATHKALEGVTAKFNERDRLREERKREVEAKEPHTYPEIIKAIAVSQDTINKLKNKPVEMREAKKLELESEFDTLVKRRQFSEDQRVKWVTEQLSNYLFSDEYRVVVDELRTHTANLSKYSDMKTQWEDDNKELIEAERLRTKREELLSADPEALRALGITPPEVKKDHSTTQRDPELEETIEALRSIHPSATEAELESMAKLV